MFQSCIKPDQTCEKEKDVQRVRQTQGLKEYDTVRYQKSSVGIGTHERTQEKRARREEVGTSETSLKEYYVTTLLTTRITL